MTIQLYLDHRSGSCRRVMAVAKHLSLDLEEVFVDLLAGGTQTEDFLALNPAAMVPVMTHDRPEGSKLVLTEAAAIMIYLCEQHPGQTLWPATDDRIEVLKWMFWAAEHFRPPAPVYFEEKFIAPLMGGQENGPRLAEAERQVERHAPVLDAHLSGRDYVVGETVTLADYDLAAALSQMSRSHVPYDRYPNIMRWAAHLEQTNAAWRDTGMLLNSRMSQVA
ncbi:MAG: glutathione S-transferase [Alphaproteobacteria bacterium]|nr:MAG: glutathione S-transferase [Alphaproteobacteria bacterium]